MSVARFLFRASINCNEDEASVDTWFDGLNPSILDTKVRGVDEWAREAMANFSAVDLAEMFDIDPEDGHVWQVYGVMKISASYDYFGEYDEDIDVLEFVKQDDGIYVEPPTLTD